MNKKFTIKLSTGKNYTKIQYCFACCQNDIIKNGIYIYCSDNII